MILFLGYLVRSHVLLQTSVGGRLAEVLGHLGRRRRHGPVVTLVARGNSQEYPPDAFLIGGQLTSRILRSVTLVTEVRKSGVLHSC